MSRMPRSAILALSIALLVALSTPFWNWIPDDAYISFQYARSLAEGDGLVFNPGERVEGFSNLLWTLLLALAARLGVNIEIIARAASLIAAVLSVWLGLILIDRVTGRAQPANGNVTRGVLALSMIAWGTFFPLAFYATAGLETTFYLFLLMLGAVCHIEAIRRSEAVLHVAALSAFLAAALTRPEGIVFLVLNVTFTLAGRRRGGPTAPAIAAVAAIAVYAVVMIIKQQYYGDIVPNTYFAKPGASFHYLDPLARGLGHYPRRRLRR